MKLVERIESRQEHLKQAEFRYEREGKRDR